MKGHLYTAEELVKQLRPQKLTQKLWRYMDFTKFINMLSERALYFPRADLFNDRREGLPPPRSYQRIEQELSTLPSQITKGHMEEYLEYHEKIRRLAYVSCWHMNDDESFSMWQAYGARENGIAIQTTYKNFEKCFQQYNGDFILGKMLYLDYQTDEITPSSHVFHFFQKRNYFSSEKEFRAVLFNMRKQDESLGYRWTENGVYVPIDLRRLIKNVYIPPLAPDWYFNTVVATLARFGLKTIPVQKSGI
ncbi:hypothetical protein [Alicyclobacillus sp. SO9]|uniref:hypothetical protein n=1 Tax=Alicyclobacillus sp. SO9 TaxID=2665646 RepID=UPI0018E74C36|nr:hypothetical protein [Alicyclobacillus sp. SO9]QQE81538.1 hypothetical protein GI364_24880 [Alicyclobacillus sp. SO9]